MSKKLLIFIFLITIFVYPSLILAQEYNPGTDRCSGIVGIKSERQATGDTECADALSCPEELRNKEGGCGPIISKEESFIDKAFSGICGTIGIFCRWGESGKHVQKNNLPYALHDQVEDATTQNQGTRVYSQASNPLSIINNLLGTQSNTGGLRGYFPNELLSGSSGKGALESHKDIADCSGPGGLGLPYELCNDIAYSPGEDGGDDTIPDGINPSPIITPSTEAYQIEGCPPSSERIFIDKSRYLHLEHQFRCSTPRVIVVHWSGGWSTAQDTYNELNLLKHRGDTDRNGNPIESRRSCQFAIDENETIQMLDLYSNPNTVQMGWCAGGDNNIGSFNLEISGAWFDRTLENPGSLQFKKLEAETNEAIRVTCDLIKRYNISKTEVYGHYQLQEGKSDPGINYLKMFKERVMNEC